MALNWCLCFLTIFLLHTVRCIRIEYEIKRQMDGDISESLKCNAINTTLYSFNNVRKCVATLNDIEVLFNGTETYSFPDNPYRNNDHIRFVKKSEKKFYLADTDDFCKKPSIKNLYYNDNGWRSDLDACKEHMNVSKEIENEIAIKFHQHFTGLLLRLDIQCNGTFFGTYLFKFEGELAHPVNTSKFENHLKMYSVEEKEEEEYDYDPEEIAIIVSVVGFILLLLAMVVSVACMKRWKETVKDKKKKYRKSVKSIKKTKGVDNNGFAQDNKDIPQIVVTRMNENEIKMVENNNNDEVEEEAENDLAYEEFEKDLIHCKAASPALDVFLNNIESTVITDQKTLKVNNGFKNVYPSYRRKDSSNDHILCGYLSNLEMTDLSIEK